MKDSLKTWRARRAMTQAQLSEKSDVSMAKIAVIESLTQDEADRIREALMLKSTDSITMPFN